MSQHYSDPRRASETYALPDVEIWYHRHDRKSLCKHNTTADECVVDADEIECSGTGWYYWFCFPGCVPEGDAIGPFESEALALADARQDTECDDEACETFTRKIPFQAHCAGCGCNSVTMDTCSNCSRPLDPSENRRVFRHMYEHEHYAKPCDHCGWSRDAHKEGSK